MIRTKSVAARCMRHLTVAAALTAGSVVVVLPSSLASATAHSWSAPVIVDPNGLGAVACASTTFCMALGSQQNAQAATFTWDGSAWSAAAATLDDPDGIVLSLSCASASFCAAADNHGYFMTWNGTSWSAPVLVDHDTNPGPAVYSLSCRSASFCMAVDNIGQALVFNGATWFLDTSPIFPDSNAVPDWVSCKSAKFCMTTREGYAASWDGRAFSAPVNVVAPAYNFTSVSCPALGSCVAVSTNAVGYYSGGTWTATEGANYGSSLSCGRTTFCISVTPSGDAWIYRKGTWSGPVNPGFGLGAVACPAWNFCMGFGSDNQGNGVAATYS